MSRAIAAVLFVIAGTALFGQSLEFEVASVRPHAAGVPGSYPATGGIGTDDPERIMYNGFTLRALLLAAFDLKHSWRILGPEWLERDQGLYDVSAKIPAGTTKEQFTLMLQHLLVERFQIILHWQMKVVPAYRLVAGKNGPAMQVSGSNSITIGGAAEETAKNECSKLHLGNGPDVQVSVSPRGVCLAASEQPIGKLADFLDGTLERAVTDRTRLPGKYDFTLFYSVEGTFMDRTMRPDSEGAPYVVTAVQEQLGLRLEPEKTSINFLVIDHANKIPTDN